MDSVSQRHGSDDYVRVLARPSAKFSESAAPSAFANVENLGIRSLLTELLMEPTLELRQRPSHQFRAQLVTIGAELVDPHDRSGRRAQLALCSEAIEFLHLGSLIVDDIQDGSALRRKGPALHQRLGVPHALSVGNWLYFRALRLLERLDLDGERRQRLNEEWHEVMELAHFGQVLDLSVSVEQVPLSKLIDVCHHCSLYKTGAIAALAIGMGALVEGAEQRQVHDIKRLGAALGVYLQQLNDIGNILGEFDAEKRFEDLLSFKPSFIWGFTLARYGTGSLDKLFRATRSLPLDTEPLAEWIRDHKLQEEAEAHAEAAFVKALNTYQDIYPDTDLTNLRRLQDRIKSAYA